MSNLGVSYPPEVFVRTPISILTKASKLATFYECEKANALSHTAAQLIVSVLSIAHGFSGSKTAFKMSNPDMFLPYPNVKELKGESRVKGPSDSTKSVLFSLLKSDKLPLSIYVQLISEATGTDP